MFYRVHTMSLQSHHNWSGLKGYHPLVGRTCWTPTGADYELFQVEQVPSILHKEDLLLLHSDGELQATENLRID